MALATRVYEEAAKQNQASQPSEDENVDSTDKKDNVKEAEYEEK